MDYGESRWLKLKMNRRMQHQGKLPQTENCASQNDLLLTIYILILDYINNFVINEFFSHSDKKKVFLFRPTFTGVFGAP